MRALTFGRRFLYNTLEFLRDCARIVNDPMRRLYRLEAQSVKVSCSFFLPIRHTAETGYFWSAECLV